MSGFNGGTFVRVHRWQDDKANGIKISYDRNDAEDTGIADGLSYVLCKDGQQTAIGKIAFAAGLKTSDGAAATASAMNFINDTDSGLYRIGANNLGIAVAGTKVIDVATSSVAFSGALVLGTPVTVARGGTGVSASNGARVYRSSEVSYAQGSATAVTFTTETFDSNGLFATATPTRLTAPVAGTYLIVGDLCWNAGNTAGNQASASIKKNGTTYLAQSSWRIVAAAFNPTPTNVTTVAQLAANDYVELEVFTEGTDTLKIYCATSTGTVNNESAFGNLSDTTYARNPSFSMIRLSA